MDHVHSATLYSHQHAVQVPPWPKDIVNNFANVQLDESLTLSQLNSGGNLVENMEKKNGSSVKVNKKY